MQGRACGGIAVAASPVAEAGSGTGLDSIVTRGDDARPPCPKPRPRPRIVVLHVRRQVRQGGQSRTPMRDVAEQLEILRRGVEAIVPEDEFVEEARALGPRGRAAPGQVRHRPDRDQRPPRPHRPAAEAPAVPGARPHGRHHHRQLHRAGRRPLGPRRDPRQAHRASRSRRTPRTTSARSAGSSTWTGPRSTTTATGSRTGRSSTSST